MAHTLRRIVEAAQTATSGSTEAESGNNASTSGSTASTSDSIASEPRSIASTSDSTASGSVGPSTSDNAAAELFDRFLARTVLISNDVAHARHPSYSDRHDAGYAPKLGGGPAIKKSAVRRYATELPVTAWVYAIARRTGVPVQMLQNRSDLPAGSTIGPPTAASLGIPSLDIGIPMLAMHSARETAATADIHHLTRLLTALLEAEHDEIPDND